MLFGEHAVLHGHLCLCAAVNLRLQVTLLPRRDSSVRVRSALGERSTGLDELDCAPPFQFVMQTLKTCRDRLPAGLDLTIESEFGDTLGLGSSAAVTVALLAAIDAWIGVEPAAADLQERGRTIIRAVQGIGSGADVAASVLGGVVAYRAEPRELTRIAETMPLAVAYSGAKEKTAVVVARVERLRQQNPTGVAQVFDAMETVTREAVEAIRQEAWARVGELMNRGQGLMEALGVSTAHLDEMLGELRAAPGILGAKISGSGLGDCIVGVGRLGASDAPFPLLPVAIAGKGVQIG